MLRIPDKLQALSNGHEFQAAPDSIDFDALVAGIAGVAGVLSGCDVTTGPGMGVSVSAGRVVIPGAPTQTFAGGSVTVASNVGGWERADIICLKISGSSVVLDYLVGIPGTPRVPPFEENPPIPPAVPPGELLLYRVDVSNGQASIVDTDVSDRRVFLPSTYSQGLAPPTAVCVYTGNVASLTGHPVGDGVTPNDGDDVLLVGQTTGSQNGLWTVGSPWVRSTKMPVGSQIRTMQVFITGGTNHDDSLWEITNGPLIVDIGAQVWSEINYVDTQSDQTINGVKTFVKSPIVPDPTTGLQAANKEWVDANKVPKDSLVHWAEDHGFVSGAGAGPLATNTAAWAAYSATYPDNVILQFGWKFYEMPVIDPPRSIRLKGLGSWDAAGGIWMGANGTQDTFYGGTYGGTVLRFSDASGTEMNIVRLNNRSFALEEMVVLGKGVVGVTGLQTGTGTSGPKVYTRNVIFMNWWCAWYQHYTENCQSDGGLRFVACGNGDPTYRQGTGDVTNGQATVTNIAGVNPTALDVGKTLSVMVGFTLIWSAKILSYDIPTNKYTLDSTFTGTTASGAILTINGSGGLITDQASNANYAAEFNASSCWPALTMVGSDVYTLASGAIQGCRGNVVDLIGHGRFHLGEIYFENSGAPARINSHAYVVGDVVMETNYRTWVAGYTYKVGDLISDGAYAQQVSSITTGIAGGSTPAWNTAVNGTTTDGGVTWVNRGPKLFVTPAQRLHKCTVAGTSAGSQPAWNTRTGETMTDGGVTWLNMGEQWCINEESGTGLDVDTGHFGGAADRIRLAGNGVRVSSIRGVTIDGVGGDIDLGNTDPSLITVLQSTSFAKTQFNASNGRELRAVGGKAHQSNPFGYEVTGSAVNSFGVAHGSDIGTCTITNGSPTVSNIVGFLTSGIDRGKTVTIVDPATGAVLWTHNVLANPTGSSYTLGDVIGGVATPSNYTGTTTSGAIITVPGQSWGIEGRGDFGNENLWIRDRTHNLRALIVTPSDGSFNDAAPTGSALPFGEWLGQFQFDQALRLTRDVQTLTANGAVTFTNFRGNFFSVVLGATTPFNATSSSVTAAPAGQWAIFRFVQGSTGGATYAWPTNFVWPTGSAPNPVTGANHTQSVLAVADGTNWIVHFVYPNPPLILTATLVAGAATVNTSKITTASFVHLSVNGKGGTIGVVYEDKPARVPGTSFALKSSSVADTSTIVCRIEEPV